MLIHNHLNITALYCFCMFINYIWSLRLSLVIQLQFNDSYKLMVSPWRTWKVLTHTLFHGPILQLTGTLFSLYVQMQRASLEQEPTVTNIELGLCFLKHLKDNLEDVGKSAVVYAFKALEAFKECKET